MVKKLTLIFIFAFLVRLIFLNQSLWLDEATTAKVVQQYDFVGIISKFSQTDFHPPLYYLFMKSWSNIFGYSELSLRMPSVIFSLGAGYVIYLIGGLWAASFFLFNPLIVYYSQEARMYLMATFFLSLSLCYFLKIMKSEKTRDLLWFTVFNGLSFLTFYGSIFFIAAMISGLLIKRKFKLFFTTSFMFSVPLLLVSPLLMGQMANSKIALDQVANWSAVLGTVSIKNLILIPIKFAIGRIDFYPKWIYYAIAGTWTAFVFSRLIMRKSWNINLYLLIFPLLLGLVFSLFSPLLQYFRFIYLILPLSLLLSRSKGRWLTVSGLVIFSLVYLLSPQFHREDWKSLAHGLDSRTVYIISSSSDPIRYYSPQTEVRDLKVIARDFKSSRLTVIPYTADIHGVSYRESLMGNGYRLDKTYLFRDLTYEEWVRPEASDTP